MSPPDGASAVILADITVAPGNAPAITFPHYVGPARVGRHPHVAYTYETPTLESPSTGEINNLPSTGEPTSPLALMLHTQCVRVHNIAEACIRPLDVTGAVADASDIALADVDATLAGPFAVTLTDVAAVPPDPSTVASADVDVALT